MKRLVIAITAVLILAGLGLWWFSDTQVVKRRTKSLLATLTLDGGTGKVSRQMGSYTLNSLLAAQVELDTPTIREANGSFERAELESAYSWLCNQAKETRFELHDFHSVTLDGEKAKVELTLFGLVELPNYRPADGDYDVIFYWQKEKDGWRLSRATWVKSP